MEIDVGAFSQAQPQAHIDTSLTSSLRPQIITPQTTTVDLQKISGPVHLAGIGGIGMSALARILLQRGHKGIGVRLSGSERRFDIGNFESYFQAFFEFALNDPQHGAALRGQVRKLLGE